MALTDGRTDRSSLTQTTFWPFTHTHTYVPLGKSKLFIIDPYQVPGEYKVMVHVRSSGCVGVDARRKCSFQARDEPLPRAPIVIEYVSSPRPPPRVTPSAPATCHSLGPRHVSPPRPPPRGRCCAQSARCRAHLLERRPRRRRLMRGWRTSRWVRVLSALAQSLSCPSSAQPLSYPSPVLSPGPTAAPEHGITVIHREISDPAVGVLCGTDGRTDGLAGAPAIVECNDDDVPTLTSDADVPPLEG